MRFCDDQDPTRINSQIKGLSQEKNNAKNSYFQNNKDILVLSKISVHSETLKCYN